MYTHSYSFNPNIIFTHTFGHASTRFFTQGGAKAPITFPRRRGGGAFEINGGQIFVCPSINASANSAFRETFVSPVGRGP